MQFEPCVLSILVYNKQIAWSRTKLPCMYLYYVFWLFIDHPRGDFTNFLKLLDLILQKLYNNKYNIVVCGDVNVNYLTDNNRRNQLECVIHSYNLAGIVEFPTRFDLNSQTAINSVFIDTSTIGKYKLYPRYKWTLRSWRPVINTEQWRKKKKEKEYHTDIKRKINKYTVADFQWKLSHET